MLERFAESRVFVVDDNAANIALLRAILLRAGIRAIFTETDSRRVLPRLPEVRPDLLILDLHMPLLDGFEVLAQIRQFTLIDYLPVLVLTADTTASASERALAAGAQDFITKPFNNDEVVLRVRNLLETRFLYTALRRSSNLGGDTGQLLQLIASRARELTFADFALVAVPEAEAEAVSELRVAGCAGLDAGAVIGLPVSLGGSTAGAVFADRVPRNVWTLGLELAFDRIGGPGAPSGPAMVSALGTGDCPSGVLLTVRDPGSERFDDHDLKIVSTFADQAGLALQRARYEEAQHELTLLADRDRIARDLNDHVIKRLFSVSLALQSTHRQAKPAALAGRISQHIAQLDAVIDDIRSAIFDLEDEPATAPAVRGFLTETIGEITRDAPLRTAVQMNGPLETIPTALAAHAAAVVREAAANAVRHAAAAELMIIISVGDGLVIEVIDDGIGLPAVLARGRGLRNLQDRADEVDGSLTICPAEDGGTRLVWTAPIP